MALPSEAIYQEISRLTQRPREALREDLPLKNLVSESFVLIEVMIELQEIYGIQIQQQDMIEIQTLGDLVQLIQAKAQ